MEIKGYKVFESDWSCRGFQYEVGKTYEMDGEIEVCERGFHFCEKLIDCFDYYGFNPENKVAEVISLGEIKKDNDNKKYCTNKIQIVREVPQEEVTKLVNIGVGNTGFKNIGNYNSGNYNTGYRNSGDYNSGNYNSGNYNTGDRNSGDCNDGDQNSGNYNSGNYNTGDRNSGDCNDGDQNSGNYNSGNYNSGNYNSGNWNTGNHNSADYCTGDFNSETTGCLSLFNKPITIDMFRKWRSSDAYQLFDSLSLNYKKPDKTTIVLDLTSAYRLWWNKLTEEEKTILTEYSYFDWKVFKEITGIVIYTKGKSRGIPK